MTLNVRELLTLLEAWIRIYDGTNHCHDFRILQSRYSARTQVEKLAYLLPYLFVIIHTRLGLFDVTRERNLGTSDLDFSKLQTMLSQAHTISDSKTSVGEEGVE